VSSPPLPGGRRHPGEELLPGRDGVKADVSFPWFKWHGGGGDRFGKSKLGMIKNKVIVLGFLISLPIFFF